MQFAVNDGVKIGYFTAGEISSPAVVLLGGAGSDHHLWRNQVPSLSAQYYVIAVDNRGSGASDCPDSKYSVDMLVDDLVAVLSRENVDRFHLVGFSMGGLIAQRFTQRYRERVESLVLMNCSLGSGNPDIVLPGREVMNMFLFVSALTVDDCIKNALDYNFGTSLEKDDPELYKQYYQEVLDNAGNIPQQVQVLVSSDPLIEDYGNIRMPVMGIFSEEDPVIPKENGDVLKQYIPGAEIHTLPGYHASMIIHPLEITDLLMNFLDRAVKTPVMS